MDINDYMVQNNKIKIRPFNHFDKYCLVLFLSIESSKLNRVDMSYVSNVLLKQTNKKNAKPLHTLSTKGHKTNIFFFSCMELFRVVKSSLQI